MAKASGGTDMSVDRRLLCGVLGSFVLTGSSTGVRGEEAAAVSDWTRVDHARVRLIDAGPMRDIPGTRLAGIEIQLDPLYLTYWRSPGEAGVPPTLAYQGSTNLRSGTLLFPAPGRFSEDGLEAIGYKGGVVFPLLVVAREAAKPVALTFALSFAICERQCLPVNIKASLPLNGTGQSPDAGLVRDALARVPVQAALGSQSGALTILAVEGDSGQDELTVLAKTTGSEVPALFAEAPDPWFVQAGAGLWSNDGNLKYPVRVLAKPPEPAALPMRLTLVGVDAAVEVSTTLDAPAPKP